MEMTERDNLEKLVIVENLGQDINIHVYSIDPDADIDEDYISKLGHDTSCCIWSFGTSYNITIHKEVLR